VWQVPGCGVLNNKMALWRLCATMAAVHGHEHFSFLPISFQLPDEVIEFKAFVQLRHAEQSRKRANQVAKDRPPGNLFSLNDQADVFRDVWIFKPHALSRGNGIFLHRPGAKPPPPPQAVTLPRMRRKPSATFSAATEADDAGEAESDGGAPVELPDTISKNKMIASSYIHPPMLLDGIKFDVRL
jgi:hypothetical protein